MSRSLLFALPLALIALPPAASARDGFLQDGGGIRTERVVGTPFGPAVVEVPALGEGRPFLEDGGGIRFAPEYPRLDAAPFSDGSPHGGARFVSPSVVSVPDASIGSASAGSIAVVIGLPQQIAGTDTPRRATYGGAKIIRVATARLDERPFDASGLDVVRVGTAKIIRIAPAVAADPEAGDTSDTRLENGSSLAGPQADGASPADRRDSVPTLASRNGTASQNETPAAASIGEDRGPAPREASATEDLEPWTEAWRSACERRHADFDASLGTYRDAAGRRRFCTGAL